MWSKMNKIACCFLLFLLLCTRAESVVTREAISRYNNEVLNLPIIIKETAGVGVKNYPIFVVVPLPQGRYFKTSEFYLTDKSNNRISAQFEVVNKWWNSDNSLRHIKIFFNTSLDAYTRIGTGTKVVYLHDNNDALANSTKSSLQVIDKDGVITVNTGPLKFTVDKTHFSILDKVWLDTDKNRSFENSEQLLQENTQKGGVFTGRLPGDIQLDMNRADVKVIVEESGPFRVVIRAEALTHYKNAKSHEHGFAVRIYAYADQSFVKVDYQLQNSSKDSVYAWPLYFNEMKIDLPFQFESVPTVTIGTGTKPFVLSRGNGVELAQESHDVFKIRPIDSLDTIVSGTVSEGFMDVRDSHKGVTIMTRNFWQMWANGLAVDKKDVLSVQLFPKWSAQWHKGKITDTGLYWLQDMQHVYKEVLFNFHDAKLSDKGVINLAKTFQSYPIASLPTDWYQYTRATLDMGGIIPFSRSIGRDGNRQVSYPKEGYGRRYLFNWVNFGAREPGYRVRSCTSGGWPHSVSSFIATENPADFFKAEMYALDEINVRPQSMASYTHIADFDVLRLSENPYCGGTWRSFRGHNAIPYDLPLLDGTGKYYFARDEQHGWHYSAEESYYFTGNLWIKDWYEFIAQFKRVRLKQLDPYPSESQRAIGHALSHALQAYRVTGDAELLSLIGDFIAQYLRSNVIPETGGVLKKGSAFTMGYLARAIVSYLYEVDQTDPQNFAEAFQLLSGIMNWNYQYCNFCYGYHGFPEIAKSDGTGITFTDPQAWYGWTTGQQKYLDHLRMFIDKGINGGNKPFGNPKKWEGGFNGRAVQFAFNYDKEDKVPPPKINNLSSQLEGEETILNWTGSVDSTRYHIVWADKPLSAVATADKSMVNWFFANVIGKLPNKGIEQTLRAKLPKGKLFIAVYAFDASGNLSEISNMIER